MAMQKHIFIILLAVLLVSCGEKQNTGKEANKKEEKKNVIVPQFSGDSAYQFVKAR